MPFTEVTSSPAANHMHDVVVISIKFDAVHRSLVLIVESAPGSIHWVDVADFSIDPAEALHDWKTNTDAEILHYESEVTAGRDKVKIVAVRCDYCPLQRVTFVVQFSGKIRGGAPYSESVGVCGNSPSSLSIFSPRSSDSS